jgi:hypothetical protein
VWWWSEVESSEEEAVEAMLCPLSIFAVASAVAVWVYWYY